MEDFRLKVFRIAAERLNFTQAAEALYMTQPAVTLQVKNLEAQLGVRLFDRSGRRLRLTPAGDALLGYARRIATLCEEAQRRLGELTNDIHGNLSLGVSTTISQYILPQVLAGLARERPGVKATVMSGNTENVLCALTRGSIELAMIEGPPRTPGVKLRKFLDDEIVLIVAHAHPWAKQSRPLDPRQLLSTPLLMREHGSGTRDVVESALRSAGLDTAALQIPMSLDSTEAIKSAVAVGLGVGLVSQWALREFNRGALTVVPMDGLRIRRTLAFAYPQGPPPSGLAGTFLEFAAHFAGELQPPLCASRRGTKHVGG